MNSYTRKGSAMREGMSVFIRDGNVVIMAIEDGMIATRIGYVWSFKPSKKINR